MAAADIEKEHKVQEYEGSVNPETLAPAPAPNQEDGKVTFKASRTCIVVLRSDLS